MVDEEAADVYGPVGLAGSTKVQAFRDAAAEGLPCGGDVAVPGDGGVAVLACVRGAGEVDYALGGGGAALALVDALGVKE